MLLNITKLVGRIEGTSIDHYSINSQCSSKRANFVNRIVSQPFINVD